MQKLKEASIFVVAKGREMLRMIKDGLHLTSREEYIFQAGRYSRDLELKEEVKKAKKEQKRA